MDVKCTQCSRVKKRTEFYKGKSECKRCFKKRVVSYRKRNSSKVAKWNRITRSRMSDEQKEAERLRQLQPHHKSRRKKYMHDKRAKMSKEERSTEAWKFWLKSAYGITDEQYVAMLEAQHGKCAICKGHQVEGRRMCVDHCHKTGQIRGLLCDYCNRGLGFFRDSPDRLREAARYADVCS